MEKIKLILLSALCFCVLSCSTENSDSSQKVAMLYEALAEYNKQQSLDNAKKVRDIHQVLDRIRSHDELSLQIDRKADSIYYKSERLLADLQKIRIILGSSSRKAGDDATDIMLGDKREGQAYLLLEKIEDYSKAIQQIDSTQEKIALLPDKFCRNKDAELAQLYFAGTSMGEAFASLSQIESRILAYEKEALLKQSTRIGCGGNISYSTIGAFATAESNVVAAGSIYQAGLFFVKILQPEQMVMEANGKKLPVRNPGIGQVSFKVGDQGLNQKDSVLRSWTGLIKTRIDEHDTTFRVRVSYTVVRPTLKKLK